MEKTIQISGLSKSYDGKKVIENLSFSVAAGEVYGLLGANGVGNTIRRRRTRSISPLTSLIH